MAGCAEEPVEEIVEPEQTAAVVEPGSPLLTNLEKSLYEISIAAAAMAELADYLQQNPSALLRGKDLEDNR